MSGNVKFTQGGQCNYQKVSETLPEGFRPIAEQQAVVFSKHTDSFALMFGPDGSCVALGEPYRLELAASPHRHEVAPYCALVPG